MQAMTEDNQAASVLTSNAIFPPPPMDYIARYTDKEINEGTAPPPPPVVDGEYTAFGAPYNTHDQILRSLESNNIQRLYPDKYDHRAELKKINHSVCLNFLDLLEILIRCPQSTERDAKLGDIETLFYNMHHLINEYRPHQARETLRLMLEAQHRDRLKITERFQRFHDVVSRNLRNCLNELPDEYRLPADLEELLAEITEESQTVLQAVTAGTNAEPTSYTALKLSATSTTESDDLTRKDAFMCKFISEVVSDSD